MFNKLFRGGIHLAISWKFTKLDITEWKMNIRSIIARIAKRKPGKRS
jgi:hypothetical protein